MDRDAHRGEGRHVAGSQGRLAHGSQGELKPGDQYVVKEQVLFHHVQADLHRRLAVGEGSRRVYFCHALQSEVWYVSRQE